VNVRRDWSCQLARFGISLSQYFDFILVNKAAAREREVMSYLARHPRVLAETSVVEETVQMLA
jgi:hypothetical protein